MSHKVDKNGGGDPLVSTHQDDGLSQQGFSNSDLLEHGNFSLTFEEQDLARALATPETDFAKRAFDRLAETSGVYSVGVQGFVRIYLNAAGEPVGANSGEVFARGVRYPDGQEVALAFDGDTVQVFTRANPSEAFVAESLDGLWDEFAGVQVWMVDGQSQEWAYDPESQDTWPTSVSTNGEEAAVKEALLAERKRILHDPQPQATPEELAVAHAFMHPQEDEDAFPLGFTALYPDEQANFVGVDAQFIKDEVVPMRFESVDGRYSVAIFMQGTELMAYRLVDEEPNVVLTSPDGEIRDAAIVHADGRMYIVHEATGLRLEGPDFSHIKTTTVTGIFQDDNSGARAGRLAAMNDTTDAKRAASVGYVYMTQAGPNTSVRMKERLPAATNDLQLAEAEFLYGDRSLVVAMQSAAGEEHWLPKFVGMRNSPDGKVIVTVRVGLRPKPDAEIIWKDLEFIAIDMHHEGLLALVQSEDLTSKFFPSFLFQPKTGRVFPYKVHGALASAMTNRDGREVRSELAKWVGLREFSYATEQASSLEGLPPVKALGEFEAWSEPSESLFANGLAAFGYAEPVPLQILGDGISVEMSWQLQGEQGFAPDADTPVRFKGRGVSVDDAKVVRLEGEYYVVHATHGTLARLERVSTKYLPDDNFPIRVAAVAPEQELDREGLGDRLYAELQGEFFRFQGDDLSPTGPLVLNRRIEGGEQGTITQEIIVGDYTYRVRLKRDDGKYKVVTATDGQGQPDQSRMFLGISAHGIDHNAKAEILQLVAKMDRYLLVIPEHHPVVIIIDTETGRGSLLGLDRTVPGAVPSPRVVYEAAFAPENLMMMDDAIALIQEDFANPDPDQFPSGVVKLTPEDPVTYALGMLRLDLQPDDVIYQRFVAPGYVVDLQKSWAEGDTVVATGETVRIQTPQAAINQASVVLEDLPNGRVLPILMAGESELGAIVGVDRVNKQSDGQGAYEVVMSRQGEARLDEVAAIKPTVHEINDQVNKWFEFDNGTPRGGVVQLRRRHGMPGHPEQTVIEVVYDDVALLVPVYKVEGTWSVDPKRATGMDRQYAQEKGLLLGLRVDGEEYWGKGSSGIATSSEYQAISLAHIDGALIFDFEKFTLTPVSRKTVGSFVDPTDPNAMSPMLKHVRSRRHNWLEPVVVESAPEAKPASETLELGSFTLEGDVHSVFMSDALIVAGYRGRLPYHLAGDGMQATIYFDYTDEVNGIVLGQPVHSLKTPDGELTGLTAVVEGTSVKLEHPEQGLVAYLTSSAHFTSKPSVKATLNVAMWSPDQNVDVSDFNKRAVETARTEVLGKGLKNLDRPPANPVKGQRFDQTLVVGDWEWTLPLVYDGLVWKFVVTREGSAAKIDFSLKGPSGLESSDNTWITSIYTKKPYVGLILAPLGVEFVLQEHTGLLSANFLYAGPVLQNAQRLFRTDNLEIVSETAALAQEDFANPDPAVFPDGLLKLVPENPVDYLLNRLQADLEPGVPVYQRFVAPGYAVEAPLVGEGDQSTVLSGAYPYHVQTPRTELHGATLQTEDPLKPIVSYHGHDLGAVFAVQWTDADPGAKLPFRILFSTANMGREQELVTTGTTAEDLYAQSMNWFEFANGTPRGGIVQLLRRQGVPGNPEQDVIEIVYDDIALLVPVYQVDGTWSLDPEVATGRGAISTQQKPLLLGFRKDGQEHWGTGGSWLNTRSSHQTIRLFGIEGYLIFDFERFTLTPLSPDRYESLLKGQGQGATSQVLRYVRSRRHNWLEATPQTPPTSPTPPTPPTPPTSATSTTLPLGSFFARSNLEDGFMASAIKATGFAGRYEQELRGENGVVVTLVMKSTAGHGGGIVQGEAIHKIKTSKGELEGLVAGVYDGELELRHPEHGRVAYIRSVGVEVPGQESMSGIYVEVISTDQRDRLAEDHSGIVQEIGKAVFLQDEEELPDWHILRNPKRPPASPRKGDVFQQTLVIGNWSWTLPIIYKNGKWTFLTEQDGEATRIAFGVKGPGHESQGQAPVTDREVLSRFDEITLYPVPAYLTLDRERGLISVRFSSHIGRLSDQSVLFAPHRFQVDADEAAKVTEDFKTPSAADFPEGYVRLLPEDPFRFWLGLERAILDPSETHYSALAAPGFELQFPVTGKSGGIDVVDHGLPILVRTPNGRILDARFSRKPDDPGQILITRSSQSLDIQVFVAPAEAENGETAITPFWFVQSSLAPLDFIEPGEGELLGDQMQRPAINRFDFASEDGGLRPVLLRRQDGTSVVGSDHVVEVMWGDVGLLMPLKGEEGDWSFMGTHGLRLDSDVMWGEDRGVIKEKKGMQVFGLGAKYGYLILDTQSGKVVPLSEARLNELKGSGDNWSRVRSFVRSREVKWVDDTLPEGFAEWADPDVWAFSQVAAQLDPDHLVRVDLDDEAGAVVSLRIQYNETLGEIELLPEVEINNAGKKTKATVSLAVDSNRSRLYVIKLAGQDKPYAVWATFADFNSGVLARVPDDVAYEEWILSIIPEWLEEVNQQASEPHHLARNHFAEERGGKTFTVTLKNGLDERNLPDEPLQTLQLPFGEWSFPLVKNAQGILTFSLEELAGGGSSVVTWIENDDDIFEQRNLEVRDVFASQHVSILVLKEPNLIIILDGRTGDIITQNIPNNWDGLPGTERARLVDTLLHRVRIEYSGDHPYFKGAENRNPLLEGLPDWIVAQDPMAAIADFVIQTHLANHGDVIYYTLTSGGVEVRLPVRYLNDGEVKTPLVFGENLVTVRRGEESLQASLRQRRGHIDIVGVDGRFLGSIHSHSEYKLFPYILGVHACTNAEGGAHAAHEQMEEMIDSTYQAVLDRLRFVSSREEGEPQQQPVRLGGSLEDGPPELATESLQVSQLIDYISFYYIQSLVWDAEAKMYAFETNAEGFPWWGVGFRGGSAIQHPSENKPWNLGDYQVATVLYDDMASFVVLDRKTGRVVLEPMGEDGRTKFEGMGEAEREAWATALMQREFFYTASADETQATLAPGATAEDVLNDFVSPEPGAFEDGRVQLEADTKTMAQTMALSYFFPGAGFPMISRSDQGYEIARRYNFARQLMTEETPSPDSIVVGFHNAILRSPRGILRGLSFRPDNQDSVSYNGKDYDLSSVEVVLSGDALDYGLFRANGQDQTVLVREYVTTSEIRLQFAAASDSKFKVVEFVYDDDFSLLVCLLGSETSDNLMPVISKHMGKKGEKEGLKTTAESAQVVVGMRIGEEVFLGPIETPMVVIDEKYYIIPMGVTYVAVRKSDGLTVPVPREFYHKSYATKNDVRELDAAMEARSVHVIAGGDSEKIEALVDEAMKVRQDPGVANGFQEASVAYLEGQITPLPEAPADPAVAVMNDFVNPNAALFPEGRVDLEVDARSNTQVAFLSGFFAGEPFPLTFRNEHGYAVGVPSRLLSTGMEMVTDGYILRSPHGLVRGVNNRASGLTLGEQSFSLSQLKLTSNPDRLRAYASFLDRDTLVVRDFESVPIGGKAMRVVELPYDNDFGFVLALTHDIGKGRLAPAMVGGPAESETVGLKTTSKGLSVLVGMRLGEEYYGEHVPTHVVTVGASAIEYYLLPLKALHVAVRVSDGLVVPIPKLLYARAYETPSDIEVLDRYIASRAMRREALTDPNVIADMTASSPEKKAAFLAHAQKVMAGAIDPPAGPTPPVAEDQAPALPPGLRLLSDSDEVAMAMLKAQAIPGRENYVVLRPPTGDYELHLALYYDVNTNKIGVRYKSCFVLVEGKRYDDLSFSEETQGVVLQDPLNSQVRHALHFSELAGSPFGLFLITKSKADFPDSLWPIHDLRTANGFFDQALRFTENFFYRGSSERPVELVAGLPGSPSEGDVYTQFVRLAPGYEIGFELVYAGKREGWRLPLGEDQKHIRVTLRDFEKREELRGAMPVTVEWNANEAAMAKILIMGVRVKFDGRTGRLVLHKSGFRPRGSSDSRKATSLRKHIDEIPAKVVEPDSRVDSLVRVAEPDFSQGLSPDTVFESTVADAVQARFLAELTPGEPVSVTLESQGDSGQSLQIPFVWDSEHQGPGSAFHVVDSRQLDATDEIATTMTSHLFDGVGMPDTSRGRYFRVLENAPDDPTWMRAHFGANGSGSWRVRLKTYANDVYVTNDSISDALDSQAIETIASDLLDVDTVGRDAFEYAQHLYFGDTHGVVASQSEPDNGYQGFVNPHDGSVLEILSLDTGEGEWAYVLGADGISARYRSADGEFVEGTLSVSGDILKLPGFSVFTLNGTGMRLAYDNADAKVWPTNLAVENFVGKPHEFADALRAEKARFFELGKKQFAAVEKPEEPIWIDDAIGTSLMSQAAIIETNDGAGASGVRVLKAEDVAGRWGIQFQHQIVDGNVQIQNPILTDRSRTPAQVYKDLKVTRIFDSNEENAVIVLESASLGVRFMVTFVGRSPVLGFSPVTDSSVEITVANANDFTTPDLARDMGVYMLFMEAYYASRDGHGNPVSIYRSEYSPETHSSGATVQTVNLEYERHTVSFRLYQNTENASRYSFKLPNFELVGANVIYKLDEFANDLIIASLDFEKHGPFQLLEAANTTRNVRYSLDTRDGHIFAVPIREIPENASDVPAYLQAQADLTRPHVVEVSAEDGHPEKGRYRSFHAWLKAAQETPASAPKVTTGVGTAPPPPPPASAGTGMPPVAGTSGVGETQAPQPKHLPAGLWLTTDPLELNQARIVGRLTGRPVDITFRTQDGSLAITGALSFNTGTGQFGVFDAQRRSLTATPPLPDSTLLFAPEVVRGKDQPRRGDNAFMIGETYREGSRSEEFTHIGKQSAHVLAIQTTNVYDNHLSSTVTGVRDLWSSGQPKRWMRKKISDNEENAARKKVHEYWAGVGDQVFEPVQTSPERLEDFPDAEFSHRGFRRPDGSALTLSVSKNPKHYSYHVNNDGALLVGIQLKGATEFQKAVEFYSKDEIQTRQIGSYTIITTPDFGNIIFDLRDGHVWASLVDVEVREARRRSRRKPAVVARTEGDIIRDLSADKIKRLGLGEDYKIPEPDPESPLSSDKVYQTKLEEYELASLHTLMNPQNGAGEVVLHGDEDDNVSIHGNVRWNDERGGFVLGRQFEVRLTPEAGDVSTWSAELLTRPEGLVLKDPVTDDEHPFWLHSAGAAVFVQGEGEPSITQADWAADLDDEALARTLSYGDATLVGEPGNQAYQLGTLLTANAEPEDEADLEMHQIFVRYEDGRSLGLYIGYNEEEGWQFFDDGEWYRGLRVGGSYTQEGLDSSLDGSFPVLEERSLVDLDSGDDRVAYQMVFLPFFYSWVVVDTENLDALPLPARPHPSEAEEWNYDLVHAEFLRRRALRNPAPASGKPDAPDAPSAAAWGVAFREALADAEAPVTLTLNEGNRLNMQVGETSLDVRMSYTVTEVAGARTDRWALRPSTTSHDVGEEPIASRSVTISLGATENSASAILNWGPLSNPDAGMAAGSFPGDSQVVDWKDQGVILYVSARTGKVLPVLRERVVVIEADGSETLDRVALVAEMEARQVVTAYSGTIRDVALDLQNWADEDSSDAVDITWGVDADHRKPPYYRLSQEGLQVDLGIVQHPTMRRPSGHLWTHQSGRGDGDFRDVRLRNLSIGHKGRVSEVEMDARQTLLSFYEVDRITRAGVGVILHKPSGLSVVASLEDFKVQTPEEIFKSKAISVNGELVKPAGQMPADDFNLANKLNVFGGRGTRGGLAAMFEASKSLLNGGGDFQYQRTEGRAEIQVGDMRLSVGLTGEGPYSFEMISPRNVRVEYYDTRQSAWVSLIMTSGGVTTSQDGAFEFLSFPNEGFFLCLHRDSGLFTIVRRRLPGSGVGALQPLSQAQRIALFRSSQITRDGEIVKARGVFPVATSVNVNDSATFSPLVDGLMAALEDSIALRRGGGGDRTTENMFISAMMLHRHPEFSEDFWRKIVERVAAKWARPARGGTAYTTEQWQSLEDADLDELGRRVGEKALDLMAAGHTQTSLLKEITRSAVARRAPTPPPAEGAEGLAALGYKINQRNWERVHEARENGHHEATYLGRDGEGRYVYGFGPVIQGGRAFQFHVPHPIVGAGQRQGEMYFYGKKHLATFKYSEGDQKGAGALRISFKGKDRDGYDHSSIAFLFDPNTNSFVDCSSVSFLLETTLVGLGFLPPLSEGKLLRLRRSFGEPLDEAWRPINGHFLGDTRAKQEETRRNIRQRRGMHVLETLTPARVAELQAQGYTHVMSPALKDWSHGLGSSRRGGYYGGVGGLWDVGPDGPIAISTDPLARVPKSLFAISGTLPESARVVGFTEDQGLPEPRGWPVYVQGRLQARTWEDMPFQLVGQVELQEEGEFRKTVYTLEAGHELSDDSKAFQIRVTESFDAENGGALTYTAKLVAYGEEYDMNAKKGSWQSVKFGVIDGFNPDMVFNILHHQITNDRLNGLGHWAIENGLFPSFWSDEKHQAYIKRVYREREGVFEYDPMQFATALARGDRTVPYPVLVDGEVVMRDLRINVEPVAAPVSAGAGAPPPVDPPADPSVPANAPVDLPVVAGDTMWETVFEGVGPGSAEPLRARAFYLHRQVAIQPVAITQDGSWLFAWGEQDPESGRYPLEIYLRRVPNDRFPQFSVTSYIHGVPKGMTLDHRDQRLALRVGSSSIQFDPIRRLFYASAGEKGPYFMQKARVPEDLPEVPENLRPVSLVQNGTYGFVQTSWIRNMLGDGEASSLAGLQPLEGRQHLFAFVGFIEGGVEVYRVVARGPDGDSDDAFELRVIRDSEGEIGSWDLFNGTQRIGAASLASGTNWYRALLRTHDAQRSIFLLPDHPQNLFTSATPQKFSRDGELSPPDYDPYGRHRSDSEFRLPQYDVSRLMLDDEPSAEPVGGHPEDHEWINDPYFLESVYGLAGDVQFGDREWEGEIVLHEAYAPFLYEVYVPTDPRMGFAIVREDVGHWEDELALAEQLGLTVIVIPGTQGVDILGEKFLTLIERERMNIARAIVQEPFVDQTANELEVLRLDDELEKQERRAMAALRSSFPDEWQQDLYLAAWGVEIDADLVQEVLAYQNHSLHSELFSSSDVSYGLSFEIPTTLDQWILRYASRNPQAYAQLCERLQGEGFDPFETPEGLIYELLIAERVGRYGAMWKQPETARLEFMQQMRLLEIQQVLQDVRQDRLAVEMRALEAKRAAEVERRRERSRRMRRMGMR